jgi:hypothetical protein
MKLSGLGKILYRVRCKWENDIGNHGRRMEEEKVELL